METLVLGGTNFIGLHLVQLLHSQGNKVTVLNRGKSLRSMPEGIIQLTADREDHAAVARTLKDKQFDVVYDIYAKPHSNLKSLLEILVGNTGHYIFCSSVVVYAPSQIFPVLEQSPKNFSADMPVLAKLKVASEELLMKFFDERSLPISIIRPSVVYGPDNTQPKRDCKIFELLDRGRKVIIPGSGQQLFHPIHVDDLATLFLATSTNKNSYGEAYTGCGPDSSTGTGYVKMVGEIMGVKPEIVHVETSKFDSICREVGISGEHDIFPYAWRVNRTYTNEKAKRDLSWFPQYSIKEGTTMTYNWWRQNNLNQTGPPNDRAAVPPPPSEELKFSADDKVLERLGI